MRKREVVKREEFVDAGNVQPINRPIHRARPTTWGVFQIIPLPRGIPDNKPNRDGYHWVCHISSDVFLKFCLAYHVLPGLTMWICFGT
jgi:hypothetical protein